MRRATLALAAAAAGAAALKPPPDAALDCDLRALTLKVSVARVPWLADAGPRVHDALQLGDCPGVARPTPLPRAAATTAAVDAAGADVFVDADAGDDAADGASPATPLRSLPAARAAARAARAALRGARRVVVSLRGTFHLTAAPLTLDDAADSETTWRAAVPGGAVVSGGVAFAPAWAPSSRYGAPVLEAALPDGVPLDTTGLFDGSTARRLPWAREPNGDAETQMQPAGWALSRGNINGTQPLPPGPVAHVEVDAPARNSSVFPYFGRDLDPRNPGVGYVWYTEGSGGVAGVYEGGFTHWGNRTFVAGLQWNATGGVDPHSNMTASAFNASGWAPCSAGRRAHVLHELLWGSWVFDVDCVDAASQTMTFSRGGWQEGRGAGVRTQPFYVEGAAEALDAPGEWWVDAATRRLHHWPNVTGAPPTALVVPVLETVLVVGAGAAGVVFDGVTFVHTVDGLMAQYTVPAPGDWSIRRAATVAVDGAARTTFNRCAWLRVGGNALLVTGNASGVEVTECEVTLPGSSAFAVVGYVPRADATGAAAAVPRDIAIRRSLVQGVGVYGKQASAVFVSLGCNVTIEESVLFSGSRAGININDGHCLGHTLSRNVLFDWVRETQDHGAVNTWNRALYLVDGAPEVPAWIHIDRNLILNAPSPNRDLGNLWPALDNDDGSAYFLSTENVLVYGACKNYLGNDKIWARNLIVFPDRWAGDACLTAWGGQNHAYVNNTCITSSSFPQAFDSSVEGDVCTFQPANATSAAFLPATAGNVYQTPDGTFSTGCAAPFYNLPALAALGFEVGSTVVQGYERAAVVAAASALLLA